MNEKKVYADEFQTTFVSAKEMLDFLAERTKTSEWLCKPTKALRLAALEKEREKIEPDDPGVLSDTEKNTQLVLKVAGKTYPVRNCAIAGTAGDDPCPGAPALSGKNKC
ncbi:hypothetical protein [Dorea sp. D27]|uniref:hypothetical protein n=1 Tax=Dorea sp. D27 TaxID=658665 RepID=UPI000673B1E7|nr:hypothetical protein [Dorea sp. D27]KMZ52785.1 hypothetical protein HMPREF0980_03146 [Dorea sp. D27]